VLSVRVSNVQKGIELCEEFKLQKVYNSVEKYGNVGIVRTGILQYRTSAENTKEVN
jgi:hypothetical protein